MPPDVTAWLAACGADLVVAMHLLFVVFVVTGGALALRWHRLVLLHLPAALWAFLVEAAGWYCPLTPLENRLRALAGKEGYSTGFIEHYLLPLLYPAALTTNVRFLLAAVVAAINLPVYALLLLRRKD